MTRTVACDPARTDEAVADPAPAERASLPLPHDAALIMQVCQFMLLVMVVLYVARPVVLPVLLAMMLKLLLQPGVRALERWRVPRGLAAALIVAAMFAGVVALVTILASPAQEWAGKLPDGFHRLQERLSFLREPIDQFRRFLDIAETYANSVATHGTSLATTPTSSISAMLFAGTANFATGLLTTLLLLFFLLVSGETFLRRLVEILPRFSDKRQAVLLSQQIESDVAAYLFTITVMNAAVGVATGVVCWACGLATPVMWGVLAFLLNYIPLVGPILCCTILLLAGLLSSETLLQSFLPAMMFIAVHVGEGQFATPLLLARRFTLNPVMIVVSLVFWYWMWGVPGAILAMPMLAVLKIACDGIRPWAAIGHLIGG